MFKLARIEFKPAKNFIIRSYTRLIDVNMKEAVIEDPLAYKHLNAFFTRELKKECRPFDTGTNSWLCPVDGAVSKGGNITNGQVFQAKGIQYSLERLLGGDQTLAAPFKDGTFATLYLSPRDYHRIHMPVTGKLSHMIYVPGRLFSVAEHTVNTIPNLFARNERVACYFETESGPMAMVLVGAMNVSAIETTWHGLVNSKNNSVEQIAYGSNDVTLERGQEMGRFNLGSTVIIIASNRLELDRQISAGQTVKLGQRLGVIK